MANPGIEALPPGPETLSSSAMPFRFETTWRSLTEPLEPATVPSMEKAAALTARPRPARELEAREWEMVLPRMRRPVAPPSFTVAPARTKGRWIVLCGALTAAAAFMGVYWNGRGAEQSSENAARSGMGATNWVAARASDVTGAARGRQLSLFRPSMSMADYQLEFSGQIESRSLGWVFRAADTRNYYVGKLESNGASSPLTVTRFAVINGVEGRHFQRALAHMPGPWKVRQEARGPRFSIYLQNQIVETWGDDRLTTGGVGFLNEREERGQVGSIQISFLQGGPGR